MDRLWGAFSGPDAPSSGRNLRSGEELPGRRRCDYDDGGARGSGDWSVCGDGNGSGGEAERGEGCRRAFAGAGGSGKGFGGDSTYGGESLLGDSADEGSV